MNLKQNSYSREISRYRDIAIHWGNEGDALYRLADDADVPAEEVIDCLQRILNCKGSSSFIFEDTNWDEIEAFISYARRQIELDKIDASAKRIAGRMRKAGMSYNEAYDLMLSKLGAAYAD